MTDGPSVMGDQLVLHQQCAPKRCVLSSLSPPCCVIPSGVQNRSSSVHILAWYVYGMLPMLLDDFGHFRLLEPRPMGSRPLVNTASSTAEATAYTDPSTPGFQTVHRTQVGNVSPEDISQISSRRRCKRCSQVRHQDWHIADKDEHAHLRGGPLRATFKRCYPSRQLQWYAGAVVGHRVPPERTHCIQCVCALHILHRRCGPLLPSSHTERI
jgi:hypothetical protein